MTRLAILESTVKQLYGTAVYCAYPECEEPLLRWIDGVQTPILNSRIAHICAASELGPRYDEAMSDEDRRAFENLILLCLPHAEEIDLEALGDRYPKEVLVQWKAIQLENKPSHPPEIPEGALKRAIVLSMGDIRMDFREAIIDLGGKSATAPGAGGSGGGAIGPGARGGDGGVGGDRIEFTMDTAGLPDEVPIEVGRGGRGGVHGSPGEAAGHTRFGTIVIPGAGRQTHTPLPAVLNEVLTTSVSSAVLATYAEITGGLGYLSRAGWASYNVTALPAPFHAALLAWVDLSWVEAQPGTEVSIEVIVELLTPSKTATVSKKISTQLTLREDRGFDRVPILFGLEGTLHDPGLHILDVSCNTGARLGQFLDVRVNPTN